MVDLTVDISAMQQLVAELHKAAATAQRVKSGSDDLPDNNGAAGRSDAADAISDFLSAWKYGAGLLSDDITTFASFISMAISAYQQTDDDLAKAARGGH